MTDFFSFSSQQSPGPKQEQQTKQTSKELRLASSTPMVLVHCFVAGSAAMKPIVNLEEVPGKVVGAISPRPPAEILERMVARFHAMGLKLPFPKGVYRFKTFEEADAWEMKFRIAAAVKRLRDHQR